MLKHKFKYYLKIQFVPHREHNASSLEANQLKV
jgi:hypothetical protein